MADAPAVLELDVYDDSATRDAIWRHLKTYHVLPWNINTKTVKPTLIAWHDDVHTYLVSGTEIQKDNARRQTRDVHTHDPITAEKIVNAGGALLQLDKPLTASEATALKEVINNNFNSLVQDMKAMAADTKRGRVEQVERDWSAKKDKQAWHSDRARKFLAHVDEQIASMKARALEDGVELNVNSRYTSEVSTTLVGKANALNAANTEVQNDLNRALITVERQRLLALRTVLLARVPPAAQAVLDNIPDAKTLMIEAARSERRQVNV